MPAPISKILRATQTNQGRGFFCPQDMEPWLKALVLTLNAKGYQSDSLARIVTE